MKNLRHLKRMKQGALTLIRSKRLKISEILKLLFRYSKHCTLIDMIKMIFQKSILKRVCEN